MRRGQFLAIAAVLILITGGCSPQAKETTSEPPSEPPSERPGPKVYTNSDLEKRPEPKVYTNADLEKLPPATVVERPAVAKAPVEVQAADVGIVDAENRVSRAQAQVAEIEKRLLAVRNPLMPRPQLPPEEAAAWQGLDGTQRAARVEGQLEAARTELAAAQQELARLR